MQFKATDSQSITPEVRRPRTPDSIYSQQHKDGHAPDLESQISNSVTEQNEKRPGILQRGKNKAFNPYRRLKRGLKAQDPATKQKLWDLIRNLFIVFAVCICLAIIASVTYVALVSQLLSRLNPPKLQNGLQTIVTNWQEPTANGSYQFTWPDQFSRDVVTKNCHSHNDYWRSVPLYEALAAGCTGVEADLWVTPDGNELYVGHTWKSTKPTRTLRSLYLDPLMNILENRNASTASNDTSTLEMGIFDTNATQTLVLMLDMKNDGNAIWPVVYSQLQPLREKGWLTYYDGEKMNWGPLTVVGSGHTPFKSVLANDTNRFIFYDAPLVDVTNAMYNATNSYYASARFTQAFGATHLGHMSSKQIATVRTQVSAAEQKGLKSRYWDTPGWPISLRNNLWTAFTDHNVGMLNVDDLNSATRWNWDWCVVAGITLCKNNIYA